jgi:outer membrane protein TolC
MTVTRYSSYSESRPRAVRAVSIESLFLSADTRVGARDVRSIPMQRIFLGAGGRSRSLAVFFVLLLAFTCSSALWAQDAASTTADSPAATAISAERNLSLEEAVELALASNLGLKSDAIDLSIKKRKADNAWNVIIPSVDLAGSMIFFNEERTVSGLAPVPSSFVPATGGFDQVSSYSATVPRGSVSGSLQASLALNLGLIDAWKATRLEYESGKMTWEQARGKLERDVRKNYFSILLLKENIALMNSNLEAASRRTEQALANYQAGLLPELSYLQAKVAMENMKPAILELNNAYEMSLASFAMSLGFPRGVKLTLQDAPIPPFVQLDAEGTVRKAADSPDAQALRGTIDTLQSTRKATFFQIFTPTLSLSWNADPTFQGDPWDGETSWLEPDNWKQSSGMFRATLAFRLNGLLPFSKEAQGLKDLQANIDKLNIALAQLVRGTELQIDSILAGLEKSRKNIGALQMNVGLAERALNLAESAYRAGSKDLLDVQNSELELRKAQLEVLKEKFNYITGLIDLEYTLGMPFGSLSGSK